MSSKFVCVMMPFCFVFGLDMPTLGQDGQESPRFDSSPSDEGSQNVGHCFMRLPSRRIMNALTSSDQQPGDCTSLVRISACFRAVFSAMRVQLNVHDIPVVFSGCERQKRRSSLITVGCKPKACRRQFWALHLPLGAFQTVEVPPPCNELREAGFLDRFQLAAHCNFRGSLASSRVCT